MTIISIIVAAFWLLIKIAVAPAALAVCIWASDDRGEWIPEDECYADCGGNPAGVFIMALIGAFGLWIYAGEITGYDIAIAMSVWAVSTFLFINHIEKR